MRDLTGASLVHQRQRFARRDAAVIGIAAAAVVTGGALLYVIFCLRKPGEPFTRTLSKGNWGTQAPGENHQQIFHRHLLSPPILSPDHCSTISSILLPPSG